MSRIKKTTAPDFLSVSFATVDGVDPVPLDVGLNDFRNAANAFLTRAQQVLLSKETVACKVLRARIEASGRLEGMRVVGEADRKIPSAVGHASVEWALSAAPDAPRYVAWPVAPETANAPVTMIKYGFIEPAPAEVKFPLFVVKDAHELALDRFNPTKIGENSHPMAKKDSGPSQDAAMLAHVSWTPTCQIGARGVDLQQCARAVMKAHPPA